ncbi:phosphatase 2C-like domain-containing protein [Parasitella parasitica]|nr:phosphatase 2C-like domain-containing protein [Parasitella parasitica]
MATDTESGKIEHEPLDTELKGLNICDQLRANSSFMKVAATIFYYGNQALTAGEIVNCVRALELLPLRGETPRSTIQGIVSSSRGICRTAKLIDPFSIVRDDARKQTKYKLSDELVGNAVLPRMKTVPDEPVTVLPVLPYSHISYSGKRQRKAPDVYKPTEKLRVSAKTRKRPQAKKPKHNVAKDAVKDSTPTITESIPAESASQSDIDVEGDQSLEEQMQVPIYKDDDGGNDYESSDDAASFDSMGLGSDYEELLGASQGPKAVPLQPPQQPEVIEDTIASYSLVFSPPTADLDYIDPINFTEYNVASNFAIVQQKGYSYPRFRSHEKIKIPKIHCEDKYRVSDISKNKRVVGRLFVLADGHGGPGCSEYFVRKTPQAVQAVCSKFVPSKLNDPTVRAKLEKNIKTMIQQLDDSYLDIKRQQMASKENLNEKVDNDGCTLILNLFFGEWLINVNIGDSRSVLISAPEPSTPLPVTTPYTVGIDKDYNFDVEFASQDHKPYLEHLARHILENGGEFVDSVQNRVIKVDVDKLREDKNRHAKRISLKNARIRPKDYQTGTDPSIFSPKTEGHSSNSRFGATEERDRDRVPSLNVARSCGDLDFKMDPDRKIISCEPDVTFIRIADTRRGSRTTIRNGPNKEKRRHFLFMSTDGTFDYMYEETADRQNKAIAKTLGPMIEDGEKIGHYLLDEEEKLKQDYTAKKRLGKEAASVVEEGGHIDIVNGDSFTTMHEEQAGSPMSVELKAPQQTENEEPLPPAPLLHKELDEEDLRARKIRERTLVHSARYFANREGAHGFFASKLQDYDDCTIILVEI